jgi:predicted nucleotidyltransferase
MLTDPSVSKDVDFPFRDEILHLARRHGVQQVSLFGSVARQQATESSDIDLLVQMEEGRTLFDLIAFKLDVEELLGRQVDVVSREGLSPYLSEYILAEERPL